MELNKERREYISTLADRIMREMVNDGYDPFKAFDYIALDDAYAKKLQQLLNEVIKNEKLEPLEIFYLGLHFGHHGY